MESAKTFRHTHWNAATLGLVLLLGGCSSAGSLFDDGAGTLASNGGTIVDAVEAIAGPSDSYCRKGDGTPDRNGMVPVYKVESGECAAGDSEIKSYEFNKIKAENEDVAWQKLHAAAQAEAAQPTYCRTATSHTAYRSSSGSCQPGEQTITAEEYSAARSEAAAAASKLP
jgi:hypothetical protein